MEVGICYNIIPVVTTALIKRKKDSQKTIRRRTKEVECEPILHPCKEQPPWLHQEEHWQEVKGGNPSPVLSPGEDKLTPNSPVEERQGHTAARRAQGHKGIRAPDMRR